MVTLLGPGALMAKSDIKNSAFRLLPVHPGDFNLLVFTLDDHFYFDKCMPMGCSISCATFEPFSTFLDNVPARLLTPCTLCTINLDDFLFVGRQATHECERALQSNSCLQRIRGAFGGGENRGTNNNINTFRANSLPCSDHGSDHNLFWSVDC